MCTFKLHMLFELEVKIKDDFVMKDYNLTLQVTELESKVSKCQMMLESQMKNMDADSGEKNRLKEEVRKTWSPTDCYRREPVKEGMIFIVYSLFEFSIS